MKKIMMCLLVALLLVSCHSKPQLMPLEEGVNTLVELDVVDPLKSGEFATNESTSTDHAVQTTSYNVEGDGMDDEDDIVDAEGLTLKAQYQENVYRLKMLNDDNHIKIYEVVDGLEVLIYDMSKDKKKIDMNDYQLQRSFYVEDNDGDGLPELYVSYEDSLGYEMVLVLNHPDFVGDGSNFYQSTFFDYGSEPFVYEEISGDGVKELISPHPGGGGYVTVWVGMDLIHAYNSDTQSYEFSYNLTRKHYEEINKQLKSTLASALFPDNWEAVLESYADLGYVSDCQKMIENAKGLEELSVHPDWDGPYETYFEFVIARANHYHDEWKVLKERDSDSDQGDYTERPDALNKVDFALTNGICMGMTFDAFQKAFDYKEPLVIDVDEEGRTKKHASIQWNQIDLVFAWPSADASDLELVSFVVKDQSIKTRRGAGIGTTVESLFKLYGDPYTLNETVMDYKWDDATLHFDLEDEKVLRFGVVLE